MRLSQRINRMAKAASPVKSDPAAEQKGITKITVAGYKSISQEQSIEIRPLTILAGANSSGKSSMMQPLLLLKQTLEASYDPGALLLDGPNVRYTSSEQLLSHISSNRRAESFQVQLDVGGGISASTRFKRNSNKGFDVQETSYSSDGERVTLRPKMTFDELKSSSPTLKEFIESFYKSSSFEVVRSRCFLYPYFSFSKDKAGRLKEANEQNQAFHSFALFMSLSTLIFPNSEALFDSYISQLIHVPGLRGNPERNYPVTAVGSVFPGTFENYVASVIAQWQTNRNKKVLESLSHDLNQLGLTWKVIAKPVNDTQVEIQVGRLFEPSKAGKRDMVSIADVGVGVSQTLPVLVALHAAKPGQLVYIEQPEIHLHPRAQTILAQMLANAAKRGVRVVVETHSSLLILGIQTLVAEGKLSTDLVKLHWFERRRGITKITSRDLDEAGAFGDWPEDFADVTLEAQSQYLDAAESHTRVN